MLIYRKRGILSAVIALLTMTSAMFIFGLPSAFFESRPMFMGVNLPSATFAEQNIPGVIGRDYFYPNKQDVKYYVDRGMNIVRLGFIWERMQPELNKPLDRDERLRLDEAVKAIVGEHAVVILDLHNYGRYRTQVVGSSAVPASSFADLWERLASIYSSDDRVMFGLMNEPHDIDATQWQQAVQAAITNIRQTGARNRILVSSTMWDSAAYFMNDGEVWKQIVDPAKSFAFEVHQYLDSNNSGTQADCPNVLSGLEATRALTQWMRQNSYKAFLGEFGASDRKECLSAMAHMLNFIQKNSDIWVGWTYFAGGRGWRDDDLLSIAPVGEQERPQMTLLKAYLP